MKCEDCYFSDTWEGVGRCLLLNVAEPAEGGCALWLRDVDGEALHGKDPHPLCGRVRQVIAPNEH